MGQEPGSTRIEVRRRRGSTNCPKYGYNEWKDYYFKSRISSHQWDNYEIDRRKCMKIVDMLIVVIWWNWLVKLTHLIIILCYRSILCNDHLNKWFFIFWGFCYKLYAQANFVILNFNWTYFHCIRPCIITLYCSCII